MIILGKDVQGENVTLHPKQFDLGAYLIGTRRQGKSTLLEHLIIQSIQNKNGVVLIDPHGDLLQQICHRLPQKLIDEGKVLLLDPKDTSHPFGLNIYHCENKDDPVAVEYTTNLVMDIYKKLWKAEYSQPMVEDIILMTTLTIIANGMTMLEVPKLLFDDAFRKQLVRNVHNADVLDFWKIYDNPRSIEREQGGGTVGRRLRRFTSSGILRYIVGQTEKAIRFRDILDQQKIVLIRLYSDLGELTSLIGSTIVSQMLQAALSRSEADERPVVHLYCDEYSRFATESFAQIIEEAGKYNLIPFIAHQSTGQISEENQDSAIQLGSLIAFKLIGKDSERIANEFSLVPPTEIIERPVRAPAQNVIEALINRGSHEDPDVNRFVQNYLKPLVQASGERVERARYSPRPNETDILPRKTYPEGSYGYDPRLLKEELNVLNTLLFDIMTGKGLSTSKTKSQLVRITAVFAQYLGFPHVYQLKEIKYMRSWDNMMVLNLIDLCLEREIKSPPETIFDLMAQIKAPLFYKHQISADDDEEFPLELTYFYTTLPHSVYMNDLEKVANLIIPAEEKRYGYFADSLLKTLDALAKSPIMIDSGKIEKIEQAATSYSDRANQVANELTQLKRGHARVKLPTGEFLLETIPSTTSHADSPKKHQIIEQTRKKYCRPRNVVEEEIRRRQELGSTVPTTRKHPL